MVDILEGLNEAQIAAVTTVDGPVLCVAGAGTGKTKTLVHRCAWLAKQGVDPRAILLVTFTRRAAESMLRRARGILPECQAIAGGTFHAFGLNLLRRYHASLGLVQDFVVLDQGDAEDALERCIRKRGLRESGRTRFPKGRTVHRVLSHAANNAVPLKEATGRVAPDWLVAIKEFEELRKDYAAFKLNRGAVDYDDLLLLTELLLEDSSVLAAVRERTRYLMVDEYQDTNLVQARIVRMIGGESANVMVVGDPAQSIYAFRGARYLNIFDFEHFWPGCRRIQLEVNYRSLQPVLDVANAVDHSLAQRFDRRLVASRRGPASKPRWQLFRTQFEEADEICSRVLEHSDDGISLAQQAILVRSMFAARQIELALLARKIPYRVFGGMRIDQAAHVKDLLALLRVTVNPADELSWIRLLKLVPGIGMVTAERVAAKLISAGTLDQVHAVLADITSTRTDVRSLRRALAAAVRADQDVAAGVAAAVDGLKPLFEQLADYQDNLRERLRDFDAVVVMAHGARSMAEFLQALAVDGPWMHGEAGPLDPIDEQPLTLSTIDGAKGLEWQVVYIPMLTSGHLPSSYTLGDEQAYEEERRVFYVAVTRARDGLYLSRPAQHERGDAAVLTQELPFLKEAGLHSLLDGGEARRAAGGTPPTPPVSPPSKEQRETLLARILDRLKAEG